MRKLFLLSLSLLPFTFDIVADRPGANLPDKVRPVPPRGADISAEVRDELASGADRLGSEIESLRNDLKGKSNALALLPDIQIFEKAVRWAVQYNEMFNATNDVP